MEKRVGMADGVAKVGKSAPKEAEKEPTAAVALKEKVAEIDAYWKSRDSSFKELEERHGTKFTVQEINDELLHVAKERIYGERENYGGTIVPSGAMLRAIAGLGTSTEEDLEYSGRRSFYEGSTASVAMDFLRKVVNGNIPEDRKEEIGELLLRTALPGLTHPESPARYNSTQILAQLMEKMPGLVEPKLETIIRTALRENFSRDASFLGSATGAMLDKAFQAFPAQAAPFLDETAKVLADKYLQPQKLGHDLSYLLRTLLLSEPFTKTPYIDLVVHAFEPYADAMVKTAVERDLGSSDDWDCIIAHDIIGKFSAPFPRSITPHLGEIMRITFEKNIANTESVFNMPDIAERIVDELNGAMHGIVPGGLARYAEPVAKDLVGRLDSADMTVRARACLSLDGIGERYGQLLEPHLDAILNAVVRDVSGESDFLRMNAKRLAGRIIEDYPERSEPYVGRIVELALPDIGAVDAELAMWAEDVVLRAIEKFPAKVEPHAGAIITTVVGNYLRMPAPDAHTEQRISLRNLNDKSGLLLTALIPVSPEQAKPHIGLILAAALENIGADYAYSISSRYWGSTPEGEKLLEVVAECYPAASKRHLDLIIKTLLAGQGAGSQDAIVIGRTGVLFEKIAKHSPKAIEPYLDQIITFADSNIRHEDAAVRMNAQKLINILLDKFPDEIEPSLGGIVDVLATKGIGSRSEADKSNPEWYQSETLLRKILEEFPEKVEPHFDEIVRHAFENMHAEIKGDIKISNAEYLLGDLLEHLPARGTPIIRFALDNLASEDPKIRENAQSFVAQAAYFAPELIKSDLESIIETTVDQNFNHSREDVRRSAYLTVMIIAADNEDMRERMLDHIMPQLKSDETRAGALEGLNNIAAYEPKLVIGRWELLAATLPELDRKKGSDEFDNALKFATFFIPYRKDAPKELKPMLERAAGEVTELLEESLGRELSQQEEKAVLGSPLLYYAFANEEDENELFIAGFLPFLTHANLKQEVFSMRSPSLGPDERMLAYANLNSTETLGLAESLVPLVEGAKPVHRQFLELVRQRAGIEYGKLTDAQKRIYADEFIGSLAVVAPTLRTTLEGRLNAIKALKGKSDGELRARMLKDYTADMDALGRQIIQKADEGIRNARGKPGAEQIIAKHERIKADARKSAERQAANRMAAGEDMLKTWLELRDADPAPIEAGIAQVDAFLAKAEYVRGEGVSFSFLTRRDEEFKMGKETADCTAPGSQNFWSVPSFLLDQGYQALQIYSNGKLYCRLDLFLGTADGRPVIIIDAMEAIPQSDRDADGKRDAIMGATVDRLKKLADLVGADVYANPFSNRKWLPEYFEDNFKEEEIKFLEKEAGLEQLGRMLKTLSNAEVEPNSYIQTMSLSQVSTGEHSQLAKFEEIVNRYGDRCAGFKEALAKMDYAAAVRAMEKDIEFWEQVNRIDFVADRGVVDCLAALYMPSQMDAENVTLRLVHKTQGSP